MGVDVSKVESVGNFNRLSIASNKAMLLRVAGNQASVNLRLEPPEGGGAIPALCVFMSGNGAEVNVTLKANLSFLYVRGSGNFGKVGVDVNEGASIKKGAVLVSGNMVGVSVAGKGNTGCVNLESDESGNGTSFNCN